MGRWTTACQKENDRMMIVGVRAMRRYAVPHSAHGCGGVRLSSFRQACGTMRRYAVPHSAHGGCGTLYILRIYTGGTHPYTGDTWWDGGTEPPTVPIHPPAPLCSVKRARARKRKGSRDEPGIFYADGSADCHSSGTQNHEDQSRKDGHL